jgi:hypothetical protein
MSDTKMRKEGWEIQAGDVIELLQLFAQAAVSSMGIQ